jgi:predicted Ser/Thr protein kinase
MPEWPTQSDYKDALQNPDTAFRDPELKASQAERSPMGVPRARSGAFASVYKMTLGAKAIALKLFNFPNADRASRYQAVSDYLKTLGPKKPASLVGFEYNPEGIRIRKTWYPTLTMEWVKGKSLGEWLREAMERRDAAAVRKMADAWAQLVLNIQAAQIAHGDLQHDNVMVVAETPVLVDYDGMCVPSLAPSDPKKRLEQLEFGKPAYQHPGRPAEKLGPHLDHFAAWVVLVALRASAADPALYTRFVTKTENENLLFSPPDMVYPAKSAVWPELLRSKDPEVRDWAKALRESLDKPFDQIPAFTLDPFAALRRMVATVPRDWAGIAAETDKLVKAGKKLPPDLMTAADPVGRLVELCKAARKDYVAIAVEADALTRSGKSVPADLKPVAADAVKRVNCRDAVARGLAAADPRAVKIAFQKALLDGWADRRLITDAETAIGQVDVLDKLKKAAAVPGDGRALVKLWAAEGFKVAGVPEADAYQQDAERWRTRIDAAEAFIQLYKTGAAEQALAAAWERAAGAGGHPDLKPEHRARGEQAARRAPLLARLAAVPATPSYANDTALLAAWTDDGTLAGCKEADRYIPRVNAARDRLGKVAALKRAIELADAGAGTEVAVVTAAKPLAGYDHPYSDRVTLGTKSVAALAALKAAVDETPPSDRAIAGALDELRATNVELLARLDKLDPGLAREAATAGRRRKALDEFAEIDRKYPDADKQDHKWQTLWVKRKELLQGRRDTEELRERLTLAANRARACADVLGALDAREMFKLRELYGKHGAKLRNYPPLAARQAELDELLAKADRVIVIQKKLAAPDGLPGADDLTFLRENHAAFRQSDRDAIVARVTHKLKAEARLVAGRPQVRVVPSGRAAAVVAYWAWAGYGLVSHCLVAVDPVRHLTNPAEAEQYALLKCQLREHAGEGGGKRVAPPVGADKVFVTVWAVVELGWTTVYGPPLHLGPAVVAAAWV